MYKAEELQTLQMKPRINDITLKVLADYYAFFLNPFIYKYAIKSNPEKSFELWFDKENFCHLLGLETIAKNSVPYKKLHKYKGLDGWYNIYGENVSPPMRIDCDIMFYSKAKNDNVIIHLGIKQDNQLGHYIPKHFS